MSVIAIKNPDAEQENIERLAQAIAERLERRAPFADTLWSGKECADYLIVSERHFMERIASTHGFPDPVRAITAERGRGRPRWYAGEVVKWMKKCR